MSEQIDWSKAPADATGHGNIGIGHLYVWFSDKWYEYVNSNHGGRYYFGDSCVYSEKDIVSCTPRPTTTSWSGEGLPPVGAVCEYNAMPIGKPEKWHKVEVVYVSGWVIVLRCIEAPDGHEAGNGVEIAVAVDSSTLKDIRPIRTPGQIAADEREAQIVAIHDAIVTSVKVTLGQCDSWRKVAEMVYNAGFKRPE